MESVSRQIHLTEDERKRLRPKVPWTVDPWIDLALDADVRNDKIRLRCPSQGCKALIADFVRGVFVKRCWRCKGKHIVFRVPMEDNLSIDMVEPMLCGLHDDQSYSVHCPNCSVPLGEYLLGVYRIDACYYCKWGGVIHRNAATLVQSSTMLYAPKYPKTVWQPGKPASEEGMRTVSRDRGNSPSDSKGCQTMAQPKGSTNFTPQ